MMGPCMVLLQGSTLSSCRWERCCARAKCTSGRQWTFKMYSLRKVRNVHVRVDSDITPFTESGCGTKSLASITQYCCSCFQYYSYTAYMYMYYSLGTIKNEYEMVLSCTSMCVFITYFSNAGTLIICFEIFMAWNCLRGTVWDSLSFFGIGYTR